MKKLLFFSVFAFISNLSFAQFNQGRMLVGGSVGFSSIKDKSKSGGSSVDNYTSTSFSVSPSVGYFVIDNLAIGGSIAYTSKKDKSSSSGDSETVSGFAFAPFVRYYLAPGFFGQGTYGIGSAKDETSFGGTTNTFKSSISVWSLGIGYAFFLNDHVAIEPLINYQSTTSKPDGSSIKTIDSGIAFQIGIQAYLGDRK